MTLETRLERLATFLEGASGTRRETLGWGAATLAAAALVPAGGCVSGNTGPYDLVYGFSNDREDMENLQRIISGILNLDGNLKVVRTKEGDYALIHDVDVPQAKAEELARLYTGFLRDSRLFDSSQHAVVIQSGILEERVRVPERKEVPFVTKNLAERKQRVLRFMKRAVDQLIDEGFPVSYNDIPFFMAITEAESSFSAELIRERGFSEGSLGDISYAGAVGYMQLMPSSVPDDALAIRKRDLGLSTSATNREYATALVEFCRGKSLDQLRARDIRFDPYLNIYWGIQEIMGLRNKEFEVGRHKYYSYWITSRGQQRLVGAEWNDSNPPEEYKGTHRVTVSPEDSIIYSLSGYNWGAPATMGFIVRHKIRNNEQFLRRLKTWEVGRRIAHYITKIVTRTDNYYDMVRDFLDH